ncbi:MAG: hypothetical protein A2831_03330 [Candidatus Yanofskybacteria bacterium RIFCSPHIGHO2_01_FULL_44_17]|uniref:Peptidase S8/S53 domain-containing protein n=1 Tax=Candidatus Yanofskybacteria bacterium RIFCSPHIGHO2_01_FULL_44_17 TaxID=1802668 RepID=A0A1F8F0B7_9BACT|nr:MAG: hypothetical protein A2831_03330 [Candidatus Yanofskybacteria bacterium RIFCSPHIGHO2_01_FULL_44_17]
MVTHKKLVFCLLFGAFLLFLPSAPASADSGRYLIKSTKGFWKNAFGVRHVFDVGFTSELSDFQIRLAKMFGVEIEPVSVLQILPEEAVAPPETNTDKPTNAESHSVQGRGKPPVTTRYQPSDQTPWGVEVIYGDSNILTTSGGTGVNVAILDTGIYSSHPDLARRVSQCKDFTNQRTPIINGKCEDKNGHGTHVAGIVAADAGVDGEGIFGIAPEAELFVYKVCGNNGSCYADDIAAALNTAVSEGANIVNMSFGSNQQSLLIKNAIDSAANAGLLLVAAAGNDGPFEDSIDYPAAYASVMAIGAINKFLDITDWSSRGINEDTTPNVIEDRDIEFAAPGEYIESTWTNGGYVIHSGTSMASPFIAGLAAKYWQTGADEPGPATRNFLHSLATDLLPPEDDNGSGLGLPQVK